MGLVIGLSAMNGVAEDARDLDERIAAIHETPNWRFVTREFIQRIEDRQKDLAGAVVNVFGTLQDENDNVIRNAFVVLRVNSASSLFRVDYSGKTGDVFATAWSDANGFFAFENQRTPWLEPAFPVQWQLLVFAPGKSVKYVDFLYFDPKPKSEILTLYEGASIQGKVVDVDGSPINQIGMAVYEIIDPYANASFDISFLQSDCLTGVTPDENGIVTFGGFPRDRIVSVLPQPAIGNLWQYFDRRNVATSPLDESKLPRDGQPRSALIHPYEIIDFTIECKRSRQELLQEFPESKLRLNSVAPDRKARFANVTVVDAVTGEGVSGIGVGTTHSEKALDRVSSEIGMPTTDEDGKVRIELLKNYPSIVYTIGRKFGYVTRHTRRLSGFSEYIPPIRNEDWWTPIEAGDGDVEVLFECTPVPPLRLEVLDDAGQPVEALVEVTGNQWLKDITIYWEKTNSGGELALPLRPVAFNVNIQAQTDDGRVGRVEDFELSKDLEKEESLQIIVK